MPPGDPLEEINYLWTMGHQGDSSELEWIDELGFPIPDGCGHDTGAECAAAGCPGWKAPEPYDPDRAKPEITGTVWVPEEDGQESFPPQELPMLTQGSAEPNRSSTVIDILF